MVSEGVIYVGSPPEIYLEGGLVHIEVRSGKHHSHRVMSVTTFRATLKRMHRVADELGESRPVRLRAVKKAGEA
jgi:hypothetical protein